MPIARIQLPDGKIGRFEVPEGTSEEQILSFAQQNFQQTEQKQQSIQPQQNQGFFAEGEKRRQENLDKFADTREQSNRQFGLLARNVLEGTAAIPALVPDLAISGINAVADTNIPTVSQTVSEGLTAMGLPEAKTGAERVIGAVVQGATGGGGLAKGVQAIKGAPKFIKSLGDNVLANIIGGGSAAGGSQVAREAGAPLPVQIGVGVGAGLLGAKAAPKPKSTTPQILDDIAEQGIDETQAFNRVRKPLINEARRQQKKISTLFDSAKEKGQNAFIDNNQLSKLSKDIATQAADEIDDDVKNILSGVSKRIDDIVDNKQQFASVNELETLRRQASQLAARGGSKSFAGGSLTRSIDDFLENAKITGDKEAVNIWKQAIRTRREFGQKFQNPAKIAKAVDEAQTIETIEREFIGTGGVSTKLDLAKTYDEAVRAVPVNRKKEVGFALRQAGLNRMIKTAAQASDSAEGLSASRLSNQIRNLRRNNKSFWDKYTPEEKQILSSLEKDLRKISSNEGAIKRTVSAVSKFVPRGTKLDIELPRTLKAKTIITVDDLLELSSSRPKNITTSPAIAVSKSINNQEENK